MRPANITEDTQEKILQLQSSANSEPTKEQSGTKIIERIPLENSPFTVVITDNNDYFITFGKYRLTQPENILQAYETNNPDPYEEYKVKDIAELACIQAEKQLLEKIWDIIGTMTIIIIEETLKTLYDLKPKDI